MASKDDDGFDKLTNRDYNFIAFCNELRAYVEEHHHFPNKHTNPLSRVKYTRKKINEGKLEDWNLPKASRDRQGVPKGCVSTNAKCLRR